jgi:two-component system OmpR family sensor kinase
MEDLRQVSDANLRLLQHERQFVQDASHELRTPITVALGHAELIRRDAVHDSVKRDAAVITEELMRLRRLADRLLLLASAEDPEFLNPTRVELDAIVVDAVHRWTATPRRWRLASTEEATVFADPERLAVALDALIENAVNHTREDEAIELAAYRRNGQAVMSVRDAGTGISSSDLGRIFDRFARADPGRSRRTGGAGLGLAIVRAIVDAHGGSIDVESVEGEGTRFEIALPITIDARGPRGTTADAPD